MNMEAGNVDENGSSNSGQLLREIEAISKALYLHTPGGLISQSKVRSRSVDKPRISGARSSPNLRALDGCVSYKDKKGSTWNWKKPLRALAHIADQKFNICFFLHVHSIEGLPPSCNDMNLSVHWKRKDESLQTRPSKVLKGTAEFGETLVYRCSVYCNRSGPHNSMKYDSKISLVYASAVGAPGVYLGKQWIDLTRLLPLTWEELVGEKGTGRWTTNFKLLGKAMGATLSVSLGFSVMGDNSVDATSDMKVSELLNLVHNGSCMIEPAADIGWSQSNTMLQQVRKVPETSIIVPPPSFQPVGVNICDDVSPRLGLELSKSMNFLYQKLNEVNFNATNDLGRDAQPFASKHGQDFELEKTVQGMGDDNMVNVISKHRVDVTEKKDHELKVDDAEVTSSCTIEIVNVDEIFEDDDDDEVDTNTYFLSEDNTVDSSVDEIPVDDVMHEEDKLPEKGSSMEDPELIFCGLLLQQSGSLEWSLGEDELSVQSYMDQKAAYKAGSVGEILMDDGKHDEDRWPEKASSMDDPELIFRGLFQQSGSLDLSLCKDELSIQESYVEWKAAYKDGLLMKKSQCLDEVAESVANEFLNMLRIDRCPSGQSSDGDLESPRGRLLREFEEEALASGGFFMEFDTMIEHDEYGNKSPSEFGFGDVTDDFDLSLAIQSVEENHRSSSQLLNRRKAKIVEDLETEALMREWGLSERAFQNSPRICSDGFGSPIELPPEEPVALPPLGEGFGPLVQTKGGGFLGSMDPSIFKNSKNGGTLIMQVSHIGVLPSELGCDIIEILQHLASAGMENLSIWLNELLPLKDVTGKSLEEIVMDGNAGPATSDGQVPFCHFPSFEQNASGWREEEGWINSNWSSSDIKCSLMHQNLGLDYATLEDLYPLIMDKIAALSIEGLRIQSGMSDDATLSSIFPQPIGKLLNFDGKCANFGGFLDIEREAELSGNSDCSGDIDELFGFSITLEEWLQLDAGIIGDDQISEHIMKILKAHHAKSIDFPNGRLRRDVNLRNDSGRRHGLLGNNLTVALKVLLRDPLRDYEPVGASMLALVQLERSFFCPRPKPCCSFSEGNSSEESDDIRSEEIGIIKEEREEWCPCFKYVEAHLSGLSTDSGKMNLWGTKTQQQSGARWLLASGMSKSYKQPLSKSKAIVVSNPLLTRKMQNSDFLWSITSQTSSCSSRSSSSVSRIRNPNVVFLN